eukprot:m.12722 g.12722  ORF g.12722 m.12722 type:complete len:586 (+) comp10013_c0_seq1:145-1902(+)
MLYVAHFLLLGSATSLPFIIPDNSTFQRSARALSYYEMMQGKPADCITDNPSPCQPNYTFEGYFFDDASIKDYALVLEANVYLYDTVTWINDLVKVTPRREPGVPATIVTMTTRTYSFCGFFDKLLQSTWTFGTSHPAWPCPSPDQYAKIDFCVNTSLRCVQASKQCPKGYVKTANSTTIADIKCEPKPNAPKPKASNAHAGAIGGGVAAVAVLLLAVLYARTHRLKQQNGDQRQLLEDYVDDYERLRNAWEIEGSELELQERIDEGSEGATGQVWRAQWEVNLVCVKILTALLPFAQTDELQQYERECDFLRRCRHANLVRFFGAGMFPSGTFQNNPSPVPFVVLELVENGSLKSFVCQHPDTPMATRLSFAKDVALGMAYIHGLDSMHRDLKPANVLISSKLRAKVADFGTAKMQAVQALPNRSTAGSDTSSNFSALSAEQRLLTLNATGLVGTPYYLAPEVVERLDYSPAADVFSYGLVLWYIISGRSPDFMKEAVGQVYDRPGYLDVVLQHQREGLALEVNHADLCKLAGTDVNALDWYTSMQARCVKFDAAERPTFEEMVEVFEQRLELIESKQAEETAV